MRDVGCGAEMGTVVQSPSPPGLPLHWTPTGHPTAQDQPLEFGTDLLFPWKASHFWLDQARQLRQGPISNVKESL